MSQEGSRERGRSVDHLPGREPGLVAHLVAALGNARLRSSPGIGRAAVIGQWARRTKLAPLRPISLWHLVESQISDRLVMHCGRQLRTKRDRPFEFVTDRPERVCYFCGLGAPEVTSPERIARYTEVQP
jgi:hypothetical protein